MHSVQVTTTRPKRRDYKCKCVTQSSKAVWIDKGWTYHGRVLLGSFRVLMYNGRALLRPFRVLIYSGRVPSGPHLQWSGLFGSSSGPFGSSFRLVGSYTPFGLYKDTTMGRGVGGRWGGSDIVVQTLLQTGCLPEQPRHEYSKYTSCEACAPSRGCPATNP